MYTTNPSLVIYFPVDQKTNASLLMKYTFKYNTSYEFSSRQCNLQNIHFAFLYFLKGVYPQSDRILTMAFIEYIDSIDASKLFVDLWVHFFLAMECIHRNDYRQK